MLYLFSLAYTLLTILVISDAIQNQFKNFLKSDGAHTRYSNNSWQPDSEEESNKQLKKFLKLTSW